jgi:hypothetical protein
MPGWWLGAVGFLASGAVALNLHSTTLAQKLAFVLFAIAVVMVPWLVILGATLNGQAQVRMWSSTWIGLDTLEIIGLVSTAHFLMKRSLFVMATASFSATLFLLDAWFDIMLSPAGSDWYQALILAIVFEIPLCLICAAIALTAPAWCGLSEVRSARRWQRRLEHRRDQLQAWWRFRTSGRD